MLVRSSSATSSSSRRSGFTIVELLIVIVVIGILAAIVVVAFNGVQRRAARAVVQSDVEQAAKEIENHRTINSAVPTATSQVDNGRGLKASPGTTYEYSMTASTFCVTGTSTAAATSYYYDSTAGKVQEGACPGHIGYSATPGTGVHVLAAGGDNSCRVRDGIAYCWGSNGQGLPTPFMQIGDGTTTDRSSPVLAGSAGGLLSGKVVTDIDSGTYHTCAIADNVPYCWGWAYLGDGTNYSAGNNPVQVTTSGVLSGKTITKISVGPRRTCVIASGAVYCWGINHLGAGGTFSTSPVAVSTAGVLGGKTVTDLGVGGDFVCVLADGWPYCWGENQAGQLGDGTTTAHSLPAAVVDSGGVLTGKTITDLETGPETLYGHACVVANGLPYCWGDTMQGGLGNNTGNSGSTAQSTPVATTVAAGFLLGKTVTDMSLGSNSTCVIASGVLYCWGYNIFGQLGNNTTSATATRNPVAVYTSGVLSGKTFTNIEMGDTHACTMDTDKAMYCWGGGSGGTRGKLGNGTTSGSSAAVIVNSLP